MDKILIAGDLQVPYHDEKAVEIFCQIGEVLRPDILVLNGDVVDWRVISLRYPARCDREDLVATFREEVNVQRQVVRRIVSRVRAKSKKFNQGNHEWRAWRAMLNSPQTAQLLGVDEVAESLSVESILGFREMGFECSGEYPAGCWLLPRTPPDRNVWVEHGYRSSKEAGYCAVNLLRDRMTNVVTGHTEKLAVIWRRAVGNRWYFAAEGGNLSKIAEPVKGRGIYSTTPQNCPDLINHQQGFLAIFHEGGRFYPHDVPIFSGHAEFMGKEYRA